MIKLEYFDGKNWIFIKYFNNEKIAWLTLGLDVFNYRTVDDRTGKILTDKSKWA